METELTIYKAVKKIIGEIKPVGETYEDEKRFNNLVEHIDLVENLLIDLQNTSVYRERVENSMKKAGDKAYKFIQELKKDL